MNFLLTLLISLKIVSLVPSVTEIIYLLKADSMLVGTTIYCDYPEAARKKPKVGDLLNPKIDEILRISPDVIFVTLPVQRMVMEKLKKLGFNVIPVSPESVEGILEAIELVGKYTGTEKRASFVTDSLRRELSLIHNTGPGLRTFFELSPRPLYTAGGTSFINEIIELAGGENIFEDLRNSYPVVRQEDVILRNPDVIILSYPGADPEKLRERIGWESIKAVKDSCVFRVDPELFTRPGPRFIIAIKELSGIYRECTSKVHQ